MLNESLVEEMEKVDEQTGEFSQVLEGSTKAAVLLRDFAGRSTLNGVYECNRQLYVRFQSLNSANVTLCSPKSEQFKRYLVALHYERYRDMIGEKTYRKAVLNVSSLPIEQVELSRRVAEVDGTFYFNLSDGTGRVVAINDDEWTIVIPEKPLFLWVDHAEPAFIPNVVNDPVITLNRLWEFINRDKTYALLQKVAFIFSFMPKSPQPISVIHGEHGSAKSYYSKMWKRFVDPSIADNASMVKDEGKLAHLLGANWFIAFDNVSGINQVQSDILCQASTGGATQSRRLYTDGESFSRDLRSVVVLNGINITPSQPDLLRRCILFFFPHISAKKRMSEEFIDAHIEAMGGDILGAIFSLISSTMTLVGKYRNMPDKPIMADFAVWGCAITEALGEDADEFLNLYRRNRNLQSEEVIKNDQVATIIKEILDEANYDNGLYMITKDSLLMKVASVAEVINPLLLRDKWFPKTTIALTRKMERLRPTLRELNIEYTEERRTFSEKRERVFVFKIVTLADFSEDSSENEEEPIRWT